MIPGARQCAAERKPVQDYAQLPAARSLGLVSDAYTHLLPDLDKRGQPLTRRDLVGHKIFKKLRVQSVYIQISNDPMNYIYPVKYRLYSIVGFRANRNQS